MGEIPCLLLADSKVIVCTASSPPSDGIASTPSRIQGRVFCRSSSLRSTKARRVTPPFLVPPDPILSVTNELERLNPPCRLLVVLIRILLTTSSLPRTVPPTKDSPEPSQLPPSQPHQTQHQRAPTPTQTRNTRCTRRECAIVCGGGRSR